MTSHQDCGCDHLIQLTFNCERACTGSINISCLVIVSELQTLFFSPIVDCLVSIGFSRLAKRCGLLIILKSCRTVPTPLYKWLPSRLSKPFVFLNLSSKISTVSGRGAYFSFGRLHVLLPQLHKAPFVWQMLFLSLASGLLESLTRRDESFDDLEDGLGAGQGTRRLRCQFKALTFYSETC